MRGRVVLISVALFACNDHGEPRSLGSGAAGSARASSAEARGSATAGGSASAAAEGSANANDPWSAPAKTDPDAPPSLVERAKLVNAVCPTVKAPYFFEVVAKNGKVSHLLGTRHVSVGLAKFPQSVRDTIKAAKLAVFEVAPSDHGGAKSH